MVVYKRDTGCTIGKWLFAAVLFILILTVTFAQVHGFNFPDGQEGADEPAPEGSSANPPGEPYPPADDPGQGDPGDVVPEPGTLILLATGLGAAYLIRRKRTHSS